MATALTCAHCGAAIPYGAAFCPHCGQPALRVEPSAIAVPSESPPVAPGSPPVAAPPAPPFRYAGFWLRFLAFLIDVFVVGVPSLVLLVILTALLRLGRGFPVGEPDGLPGAGAVFLVGEALLVQLVFVVIEWLYFALLESSSWQATVGKRALGLQVTDTLGRRITFGRATGRYFAKIISRLTLLIGYLLAGFTARKQALHDLIADCLVIRRP